jgi:hypothetical protein
VKEHWLETQEEGPWNDAENRKDIIMMQKKKLKGSRHLF